MGENVPYAYCKSNTISNVVEFHGIFRRTVAKVRSMCVDIPRDEFLRKM